MFRNFFTWKKDEPSNLGDEITYADSITKEIRINQEKLNLEIVLKPQNNINFLDSFRDIDNSSTYKLVYSDESFIETLNTYKALSIQDRIYLIVDKLTIVKSITSNGQNVSCAFRNSNVSKLTVNWKNGSEEQSIVNNNLLPAMCIANLFQVVNTNTTSVTPIDLSQITSLRYIVLEGEYNKAILTNAISIYDIEKCSTNAIVKGDLTSLYDKDSDILPRKYQKNGNNFIVSSINAVVNTGIKDSNNKDIIIGINNVNIENNANDSYINLVNEDISQNILERDWNNFYVNQITMLKSQKDLLDTVPENEEHPEDGPWKMIGYRGTEGIQANVRDSSLILRNDLLVTDVEPSSETDYVAIQLDFADQYRSGFLNSEIENGVLTLYLDRTRSDKFRRFMEDLSYTNLLLYVNRMEFTENIYFYSGDISSVHIYYYNGSNLDSEYVSEPKVYSNFKTKIENLYYATTNDNDYLYPMSYFNENKTIQVSYSFDDRIDIITNAYCTSEKIHRNLNVIKSQKINLFVNGEIPTWVFKEVLPLQEEVVEGGQTKIYKKYIDPNGNVYRATEPRNIDDLEIIGINADPGMKGIKFPYKGQEVWPYAPTVEYDGSSINLSDIEKGAAANLDTFKRMYVKEGENKFKKVFYVNEVKLLKRFQEKLPVPEGTFTYFEYESDVNKEKNSAITWSEEHDWSLDLPDCYEGCEIDEDDTTQLVIKFGTYEQFDPDAYLLENVISLDMYLDVSMSTNVVNNFSKVKIYLEKLKYFNSRNKNSYEIDFYSEFRKINILFNENGFIGTKQISYDFLTNVIEKCYVIGGTNKLENSIIMIEPLKNAFIIYDNKECIAIPYSNFVGNFITINSIECTNIQDQVFYKIKSTNLLIAGEIPTWIMKYMPLPINLKFVTQDSNYRWIYELTDSSTYDLQITSVNALPIPDDDVGIDNSDPDDQCTLNLEEFINPPKEDP